MKRYILLFFIALYTMCNYSYASEEIHIVENQLVEVNNYEYENLQQRIKELEITNNELKMELDKITKDELVLTYKESEKELIGKIGFFITLLSFVAIFSGGIAPLIGRYIDKKDIIKINNDIKLANENLKKIDELSKNAIKKIEDEKEYLINYQIGQSYMECENHKMAYIFFKKAIKINSMKISGYRKAILSLLNDGYEDIAKKEIDQIPNELHNEYEYKYILASYEQRKGNISLSEKYYKDAISDAPNDISLFNAFANFYYNQKKYEEAIKIAKMAIEIDDGDSSAYYVLGLSRKGLQNTDDNEILKLWKKAHELNVSNHRISHAISLLLFRKGDYEGSLNYLNKSISANPSYIRAYTKRGEVYLELGKKELAIYDYKRANELSLIDGNSSNFDYFVNRISDLEK